VESPGNTGAVVLAETADARNDIIQVVPADFVGAEAGFLVGIARFRWASQIEDDFNQVALPRVLGKRFAYVGRQDVEQSFQVVNDYFLQ